MTSRNNSVMAGCVVIVVCVIAGSSRAGGFDNSGVGIKGISMGGALVGIADDASAVYYNPAGLAMKDQNSWDGEIYGYGIFTDFKYTANSIENSSDEIFIIPGLFVSRKQDDWAFGLG
ncbi:MAG: outer membrane protein transport protein, partial [Euryarchaeota archaeon]|nr:outer membrane protein transport protein [Euryarchaeota archaeon]